MFGALAHLARALRWQRRGEEFESPILHQIIQASIVACFLFFTLTISLTFAILMLGQYVVFCCKLSLLASGNGKCNA